MLLAYIEGSGRDGSIDSRQKLVAQPGAQCQFFLNVKVDDVKIPVIHSPKLLEVGSLQSFSSHMIATKPPSR